MATVTEAPASRSSTSVTAFDLTVDLFGRMVESGLMPRGRRIFLRDGRLYEKMAKTKAHGYVGAAVNRAVGRRLPDGWDLWPESTIVLDPANAPLPDFAVIRGGSPLDYASPERYPGPGDVGLVIEVAVTSLRDDLTVALESYARALIPVYWVVDVQGRRILVYSEPRTVEERGEYVRSETYRAGESLPLTLDGREAARVPFDEILR